jgi:hypothetical protein
MGFLLCWNIRTWGQGITGLLFLDCGLWTTTFTKKKEKKKKRKNDGSSSIEEEEEGDDR